MEYIEKVTKLIREDWFEGHQIKRFEGEEGFQRISFGKEGTQLYQVDYVLSDDFVFVSGDLGDAVYKLGFKASLDNLKGLSLSGFTRCLTAHEKNRWDLDSGLAQEEIEDYILDWCDAETVDELNPEDRKLYNRLMTETKLWGDSENFLISVYSIFNQADAEWFDGEAAECIAKCGRRLNPSFIAYWLGLQMIIEKLEAQK